MGSKPTIRVVSAEIQREGRYLITQRSASAVLPLLWEFPGGRVREGESDFAALVRAAKHRIGVQVVPEGKVLEVSHEYSDYVVVLCVYHCSLLSGEPFPSSVHDLAWVEPEEFGNYTFPDADEKTVTLLLESGDH